MAPATYAPFEYGDIFVIQVLNSLCRRNDLRVINQDFPLVYASALSSTYFGPLDAQSSATI
jgi:hypothetical protein